jgi:hypothetical protein
MTSLLPLLTLMFLIACTPSPDITDASSSSAAVNEEAPYIWMDKNFPKSIQISPSFSGPEIKAIKEMGSAWDTAVTNQKNFFKNDVTDNNNNFNITKTDKIFGVYKALTWPSDVSDMALAITQLFGRRYNVGESNEYVGIIEGDIIVNYSDPAIGDPFTFDSLEDGTDEDDGFDLRTVILHEMGHFLGLQHIPDYNHQPAGDPATSSTTYKASSVMYPSINQSDDKRVPKTKDINALVNKYNIGGGAAPAMVAAAALFQPKNNDPGKNVKIVIELRKSGECIHKEDGAVIRRHHVKLK